MKSEHKWENSRDSNIRDKLLFDIIDINRFKSLDDKYIITDICKKLRLKYTWNNDTLNIYDRSFVLNIQFLSNRIRSIAMFIDNNLFRERDMGRLSHFMDKIIINKGLNISVGDFKNIIKVIREDLIKESREVRENVEIYISKIININIELIFLLITLRNTQI